MLRKNQDLKLFYTLRLHFLTSLDKHSSGIRLKILDWTFWGATQLLRDPEFKPISGCSSVKHLCLTLPLLSCFLPACQSTLNFKFPIYLLLTLYYCVHCVLFNFFLFIPFFFCFWHRASLRDLAVLLLTL